MILHKVIYRIYMWNKSQTTTAGLFIETTQRIQLIVKAQRKVRKSPQKHSMAADGLLGLNHLVKRCPISLSPFECMILKQPDLLLHIQNPHFKALTTDRTHTLLRSLLSCLGSQKTHCHVTRYRA